MPMYEQERQSAKRRGYDQRWHAEAAKFKRLHPVCLGCAAVGKRNRTEVVDHVEPHKGDQAKFWNRAMWQPACRWHHDVIKQQLERMYEQGEATVKDLWLNSAMAISMTKKRQRIPIGVDGWPTG